MQLEAPAALADPRRGVLRSLPPFMLTLMLLKRCGAAAAVEHSPCWSSLLLPGTSCLCGGLHVN
jgi:hypothetical protein